MLNAFPFPINFPSVCAVSTAEIAQENVPATPAAHDIFILLRKRLATTTQNRQTPTQSRPLFTPFSNKGSENGLRKTATVKFDKAQQQQQQHPNLSRSWGSGKWQADASWRLGRAT